MSGIVGIFSAKNQELSQQFMQKIRHRGSSVPKEWKGPTAALGMSGFIGINEPSEPQATPSNERAIVMDGRLTNAGSIRSKLILHNLDGETDAETVLHFYEERGSSIFGKLEGEFALALVDGNRLLLARDRLGIRPLYYGFYQGEMCFASEIKALVDFVEVVHEFPPGHFLTSDWGLYPYQPYFPEAVQLDGASMSAKQLAVHLKTAVRRALPERGEIGVWLSGGVDSSVIAALTRPFVDRLYTFSAGVEGAPDLEYARMVAEHIGSEHHEMIYELKDMLDVIDEVVYNLESFDAPLVHSSISNYLVSRLASDHVPFVLSGEGGDELFAGYAYQKDCKGDVELTLSIQEAISALHNTALQRVDRSATVHSCGVAAPFLDPDVVRFALAIPARWMIRGPNSMDKWPLRQGLVNELPEEVIWRGKSKFWQGSGTGELLSQYAADLVSDEDFQRNQEIGGSTRLHSKEEYLYYRIFRQCFGNKVPLEEVGRTKHI
jgi:asparagine synthase (glutamine-hydrolysing)